jgi:feruloyl esterase
LRRHRLWLLLPLILTLGPARAEPSRANRCIALASAKHRGFEIVSATASPAGNVVAGLGQEIRVPASCRVVGIARPTADSEIGFELWLPDGWNGRYSQLGNGGFAGNIDHPSLAAEIRRGNAAAMTDTGHKGSQFDASWALGHPEKVVDYGYRSIGVTADTTKRLIADYYGRPARRRYFIGCSNGGRQALMAAQRYPADWDGIIAGSPAVQWTRQIATFAAIQHRLRSGAQNWIPTAKLPAIERAAVAACGDRSLGCRIDVRKLVCRGDPDCLTPAQAASLDLLQSGVGGYPGFDPTGAAVPQNWDQWIVNPDRDAPSQLAFATSGYRYLILEDPRWQVEQFDPARDIAAASDQIIAGRPLARILNADDPNLDRFKRSGGKLIMYVGTADALISPSSGAAYYRSVVKRIGGIVPTQAFFRLFVVPGMQHCQGGLAPNAFGQAWLAPGMKADALHDIRLALEAWVERGAPPASIVAAKYRDDRRENGPTATLRLWPYGSIKR